MSGSQSLAFELRALSFELEVSRWAFQDQTSCCVIQLLYFPLLTSSQTFTAHHQTKLSILLLSRLLQLYYLMSSPFELLHFLFVSFWAPFRAEDDAEIDSLSSEIESEAETRVIASEFISRVLVCSSKRGILLFSLWTTIIMFHAFSEANFFSKSSNYLFFIS